MRIAHSGLMLAARITLALLSVSCAMNAPKSAAALATFLPRLMNEFSQAYPRTVLRVGEVPVASYSGLRERTHDVHLE